MILAILLGLIVMYGINYAMVKFLLRHKDNMYKEPWEEDVEKEIQRILQKDLQRRKGIK